MASAFGIERFIEGLKQPKNTKTVLYCAVILVALLVFLLPGTLKKSEETIVCEEDKTQNDASSAAALEKKLEEILSSMRGAGRVRVMLTLDRTAEQIIASNEKNASGEKSTSSESRPATVQSGGREEAIVLSEVFPRIRGVIVIAEGAADIGVRQSIIAAVSTVLGIEEKNVEVFVMAG